MKLAMIGAAVGAILAVPAIAQEAGDAANGEKEYRKCRACHMIQAADGTSIVKGGGTGPNLWNVIGRKIASVEGYSYGEGILEALEMNPDLVWTEAEMIAYVTDPNAWLLEKTGDPKAKTKMTFKLPRNQADLAAYLTTVSPDAPAAAE